MSGVADPIAAHLTALRQPPRDTLTALRATLRELLPDAQERLGYRRPCFEVHGVAVAGFDGFERHCSSLPHSGNVLAAVPGIPAWCTVASQGTLRLPVDRPLPQWLVRRVIRARLDEIDATDASGRGG